MQPIASAPAVVFKTKSGPNFVVRAFWFVFVGWWLTGIMSVIAWLAMVSIIGLPLGAYLINRIPTFITLRPRSEAWVAQNVGGVLVVTKQGRPQQPWFVRIIWFLLVGWWASALWMLVAYVLVVLILTLPIGLLMYNRVPFIASLYRY